jgi:response regulator RpfG family c-di-GMP phosphodiesterase
LSDDRKGENATPESTSAVWTGPPRRVLVLDDDALIVRAVGRMLRSAGLVIEGSTDAAEALAIAARDPPHAVISDLHMPQACGAKVLAQIATIAPSAMRVLMSADPDFEPREGSLADARVHALMSKIDLRTLTSVLVEQLRGRDAAPDDPLTTREETARRVARALARPAHEDDGHRERVARWTASLAKVMGLADAEIEGATLGAILHDVGQVTVRDRVLASGTPLTSAERDHVATHPEAGARIVADMPALRAALPVISGHHERQDGAGYPTHADASAIPAAVRVFQVVDAYDAMTQGRSYHTALDSGEAVAELLRCGDAQFDPEIVGAFLAVLGRH